LESSPTFIKTPRHHLERPSVRRLASPDPMTGPLLPCPSSHGVSVISLSAARQLRTASCRNSGANAFAVSTPSRMPTRPSSGCQRMRRNSNSTLTPEQMKVCGSRSRRTSPTSSTSAREAEHSAKNAKAGGRFRPNGQAFDRREGGLNPQPARPAKCAVFYWRSDERDEGTDVGVGEHARFPMLEISGYPCT
jgi:hypothetical protein